jgi:hypothetical protein
MLSLTTFADELEREKAHQRTYDAMARLFITWVVESTDPGSEERISQFELITDQLARTTVRIGLNQADTVLMIDFPNRPRPH